MPDCLLGFVRVTAGRDALGSVHIYYGDYFVGAISHDGGAWTPRLHDIPLGRFDDLGSAVRVVCEWYYGSSAAALPVRSLQAQRTDQDQK